MTVFLSEGYYRPEVPTFEKYHTALLGGREIFQFLEICESTAVAVVSSPWPGDCKCPAQ